MNNPLTTPHATPAQYLQQILQHVFQHDEQRSSLIVYDQQSSLSQILYSAYRQVLPNALFLSFENLGASEILQAIHQLKADDLVVLIQSENFRLNAFRLRIELFNRRLKVLEHAHLGRLQNQEIQYYLDSLAYDPHYYRALGPYLKSALDQASGAQIECGTHRLHFNSVFEPAKLNIGDYTGMVNKGGLFPIGEVFSEAKNLSAVQGTFSLFAFADLNFSVNTPDQPITLTVSGGRVEKTENVTPAFEAVLNAIRKDDGEVWLREVGFGINRAFTRERRVTDVGTYERMMGLHFSLGSKHAVYAKPQFSRHHTKHHVDVFVDCSGITLGEKEIWKNGNWVMG